MHSDDQQQGSWQPRNEQTPNERYNKNPKSYTNNNNNTNSNNNVSFSLPIYVLHRLMSLYS